jgi:hypothetical protein
MLPCQAYWFDAIHTQGLFATLSAAAQYHSTNAFRTWIRASVNWSKTLSIGVASKPSNTPQSKRTFITQTGSTFGQSLQIVHPCVNVYCPSN